MTALSIVSGTYNRLTALQNMVQSVRDTLVPGIRYEIILVDGGSTDGTLAWARQQPDVRLIEHGELRGAIPAFCDGAKAARGKYVVLANDDITFKPGALLAAIVYLEEYPACGAVAFADNRPGPYNQQGRHQVQYMPAVRRGKDVTVIYAQVGMVRKWLGDHVGWWGADDSTFPAKTYGGDNYLSSRIWEMGYSVDPVPQCQVDDLVIRDDLRAINNGPANEVDGHSDTEAYYRRFPKGATIPDQLQVMPQDKRNLRILYLPIFEPGHKAQHKQKQGLRRALQQVGWVYEWDYLASKNPDAELLGILERWRPDLLLTQLHGADVITPELAMKLRQRYRTLVWVNWNGDYWPHGLTTAPVLKLLRYVNLQLTVNNSVIPTYTQAGIPAAYWQIGYEDPVLPLPKVPAYDVVFLGNVTQVPRKALGQFLRTLPYTIGLYGMGWDDADGECLYDFATERALYQTAKLAIGDNMYTDAVGFVSNRLFQVLAADGALLLHQPIPGLKDLTGITAGVHYVEWTDHPDLRDKIQYYLTHEDERQAIAHAGSAFVRDRHSFAVRVRELFVDLLPLANRELKGLIGLKYIGKQTKQFSVRGLNGRRYTVEPALTLFVDQADADYVLRTGVFVKVPDVSKEDRIAEGVPS